MPKTILSSRTEHQCERLHSYLQEFKSVTTIEARRELDILMPAARIFDLKSQRHQYRNRDGINRNKTGACSQGCAVFFIARRRK